MAMKACFRFIATSTEASAFQSHPHLIFSTKKQSPKPAFFPYPLPKSFLFESTKKKQNHLFICRAKNIVDEVLEVTDETWKELVIDSENLVIVQFWAPSCGPCKLVEPVVGDLIKEYAGKVAYYKINTDECLKMASQYGIRSIPTVLVFKDGKQKECITGAISDAHLKKKILCAEFASALADSVSQPFVLSTLYWPRATERSPQVRSDFACDIFSI